MAIENFAHKGLKELFISGKTRRIDARVQDKLADLLDILNAMTDLKDLRGVAGFHALRGDRRGQYAMIITKNWRLTFSFEKGNVRKLNLEDYH